MLAEVNRITETCRHLQSELHFTVEPGARAAIASGIGDWARSNVQDVGTMEAIKLDEYRQAYAPWVGESADGNRVGSELHDQIREAMCFRAGKWAFQGVEVLCAAGLAAVTLNGQPILSAIVGCTLAFLLASAVSIVVSRWVRHGATGQPAKQMHRINRSLMRLGGLWLLACVAALSVVRSPDSAIGSGLFWVAMGAITLLSPLCSGLCGVAAELLSWSRRISRELLAIRSLSRELKLLVTACERNGAPAPATRSAKIGFAIVAALLCCGVGARAGDLPVRLYADVSPSARSGDVIQILKNFARELSAYDGPNGLNVALVPFYADAFTATSFIAVNIAGDRTFDCPAPASELVSISRSYADAERRRCGQIRDQARHDAEMSRSSEIAKLSEAIDRLAELKLPGGCTAVNALIRRATREKPNGVSLVVSDMENTCPAGRPAEPSRPENQTFVIPVGSRLHPIEEGFDRIRANLAATSPGVEAVEPFRLEVVMNAIAHMGDGVSPR